MLPAPPAPIPAAYPSGSRAPVRWTARAAVAALLGVLALAGLSGPAAAHDTLTGSTPADGASVDVPPAAVELTFSSAPLALGTEVQVTGPDGAVVSVGDPQLGDDTVTQPLTDGLPAGQYAVAWRVTSADGHPISGELAFTAAAAAPAAPAVPAEPAPTTTEPAPENTADATPDAPEPSATEPQDAPGDVLPEADAEVEEDGEGGVAPWVIGVAIALVLGGVAAWAVRRRPGTSDRA
ncbi:copper resistance protein CopC [Cellulomonas sp. ATA003]|uniref:copper resistance CopC family protein n=1 Tax=Cellulomonas sp. ATA003 TaxID=3073064 RepID=UPI00287385AF|nr:copper resistance protein CopC [Cellulomonas sp. ATA003]WNB87424.1 copper resistance protein CopC [Cellulomonas sp. ATA003]